jgi:hypothetical protein
MTHRLLDQLTGTPTTVTLADYLGEDPWQAEDLIACRGKDPKRFGDATRTEQAQALSGNGPCQFVESEAAGAGHRATVGDHHVHAQFDTPYGQVVRPMVGAFEKERTRLDIDSISAESKRHYQTDLRTRVASNGDLFTWRDAIYYAHNPEDRTFVTAGCMTRLDSEQPPAYGLGLRSEFDLSAPSPNGFQLLSVSLDRSAQNGSCSLLVRVAAELAGEQRFAHVRLEGSPEPRIEVTMTPSTP